MLKDKIVIVTGAAGLIGRSIVSSIISEGGTVVLADINLDSAKSVASNIGGVPYPVDITSKESIKELIDFTCKNFGKIDCVINNAYPRNKNYGRKFEDVEYSDFCENVNLHLGGYFLVSQLMSEYFKNQGYGNIIQVSSIYGVKAPKFDIYDNTKMTMPVEYAAIKSAVIHLSKYIARYYEGFNIRSNSISLGGIEDGQDSEFLNKYNQKCLNKGMLKPDDIVGTIVFLISDKSKYINGQNIIVDDGWSL